MDHRQLIYDHYLSARVEDVRFENLDALIANQPYLQRVIQNHFPQDREANIVDLGCGYGAFVHLLTTYGYHNVLGVDISPEQVQEAKRLGVQGVQQGDLIETLNSLDANSQDVVITIDVIEHFTKEELVSFAQKVFHVLRSGGRWIIHVPNGEGPFGANIFFSDFTHQVAFTRKSISQFLLASKFSRVDCYEDKIVVNGIKGIVRLIIWGFYRTWIRLVIAAETGDYQSKMILTQNMLTVVIK